MDRKIEGLDDVTRFEIIDNTAKGVEQPRGIPGRFARYDIAVELRLQDYGRTLKVFLSDRQEEVS
jgi:hypothetical protein